jgi:2-succinyl-6-hydroxy-2,4-cyclohexadiene-1-carboxylate synthase
MTSPLLCLHGFMGAEEDWDAFKCGGRTFFPSSRVLTPTLPGHGNNHAAPSMKWILDQVRSLPARPIIIGYSMGGRLALHAATQYPEMFSGLIAISASPGIADPAARSARRKADAALARRLRSMKPAAFRDFLHEWWYLPVFSSPRRAPHPPGDFLASRLQHSPSALARCLTRWGQGALPPVIDKLPHFQLPALFIAGKADTTYTEYAIQMASACPRGRSAIIPNTGHAVLNETSDMPSLFNLLMYMENLIKPG